MSEFSMLSPSSTGSGSLLSDIPTTLLFLDHDLPTDYFGLFTAIHKRSKERKYPILSSFLSACIQVLRDEIALLPPPERQLFQPWQNIIAFASQYASLQHGPLGSALKAALLCALQLATLIGHHEAQGHCHLFDRGSATLSGLGIGLLSAAAVSASSSLVDLAQGGPDCVRLNFRLCLHIENVSQSLESSEPDGSPKSTTYTVMDVSPEDIQKELDQFNKHTCCPEPLKVFISACDKTSVSVSGPQSRLLKVFQSSQVLRCSQHVRQPIKSGICQASHIYNESDVESILGGCKTLRNPSRPTFFSLLSRETPYVADTAEGIYAAVVSDILTRPGDFDKMASGVLDSLSVSTHCKFLRLESNSASSLSATIDSSLPDVALTHHNLSQWLMQEDRPTNRKDSKLAIVGISCRLPGGANDSELFWKLLMEGRDVHSKVPPDRFDLTTHFDPSGEIPNTTETPYGNFIDNPGYFDAGFFNMSPREAEQTDPMHRLALVTAYEALEMSGYSPNRTPSTTLKRVGTYYGQASDDWRETNAGQCHGTYAVPGGVRAFANGRINYFFKFGGPSFNIDTACSSGLAAVQAACSALWADEVDMVLAGGLNVITNPENFSMLCKGYFLSKTGQCKVWDNSADGYCRADGIGSVVIKRLEDAEADNDNILAVISAAATNHSAEAISITQPHAGAQMDNYRQILHAAGVSPLDVGYVELHGTGTQTGDAVESESVATVFAPLSPRRKSDQRLHLGSVKSNIGHGEAAAGIASLVKVLLILQKGVIPPHVGLVTGMNPVVARNLAKRNAGLVLEPTPWPSPSQSGDLMRRKKRYAVVNSFGAHGGNTTLLLEDAPARTRTETDPRSTHVITLSAKSKPSLRGNAQALVQYLEEYPGTDLGDLSYTLTARRIHHPIRLATAVSSIHELRGFLTKAVQNIDGVRPVPSTAPTVAFAFTGQGVFYDGISRQLFQHFPIYRAEILQLDGLVRRLGFTSVLPRIECTGESHSAATVASPVESQLAIVVVEIALSRFWKYLGVVPSVVIGHSLGEYAALVAAGVLSAADAIYLVGKRAQLIQTHCRPGDYVMLSVRAGVDDVKGALGNASFEISCLNGPQDTVISGERDDMAAIQTTLESAGYKCILLDLPYAFHTAQMEPLLEAYEEAARHVIFKAPQMPVLSPHLGSVIFDKKTINAQYLGKSTRGSVKFIDSVKAAYEDGIIDDRTVWVEIGPHPVCSAFLRSILSTSTITPSLRRNENNFKTLADTMAKLHSEGVPVEWNEYFRPYERAHQLLNLPAYRWNEKNYWIQYEGTWTLDKAYPPGKNPRDRGQVRASSIQTPSVQQVLTEEIIDTNRARLTAQSDLWHPSLLPLLKGCRVNGYASVGTVVWMDMGYVVGEYLYRLLLPNAGKPSINLCDFNVEQAQLLPKQHPGKPHLIHIVAEADLTTQSTTVYIHSVSEDGTPSKDAFVWMTARYEDPNSWKHEWKRTEFFVQARINDITRLTSDGTASRLSHSLTYELLRNVIELDSDYKGMRSAVLAGNEAFADVTLSQDKLGAWHMPPHWITSLIQISAVVTNCGDAYDPRKYLYVLFYWGQFRLLDVLKPGAQFQSYSHITAKKEPHLFGGDVYIMQDDTLVGMLSDCTFRRVPRLLVEQLFHPSSGNQSQPSNKTNGMVQAKSSNKAASNIEARLQPQPRSPPPAPAPAPSPLSAYPSTRGPPAESTPPARSYNAPSPAASSNKVVTESASPPTAVGNNSTVEKCLQLIAQETGTERSELTDDASFIELGIDSLMSLVLSEKFRTELDLEIKNTVFLECLNVAELKDWISGCC